MGLEAACRTGRRPSADFRPSTQPPTTDLRRRRPVAVRVCVDCTGRRSNCALGGGPHQAMTSPPRSAWRPELQHTVTTLPKVELPAGTTWRGGGFNGAVLLYQDLVAMNDPAAYLQANDVVRIGTINLYVEQGEPEAEAVS